MRRLPIGLLAILIAVGVAVLGSSGATATPPVSCGPVLPVPPAPPVAHWVDACFGPGLPPVTDVYPNSGALVGIDVNGDCLRDLNLVMNATLPLWVNRQDASDLSANFPPLGSNPPPLHTDVIDTEIVQMQLTGSGVTIRVGPLTPGLSNPLPQTLGAIHEQATNAALADSFFNVFFEASGIPLNPLAYNHQAFPVTSVIDRVPPAGVAYMHPSGCVPLFTLPLSLDPLGLTLIPNLNLVEAKHLPDGFPAGVVGGIFEEPNIAPDAAAADASGNSGLSPDGIAAIAGGLAAAAVALVAGGWYARRRWLRREG
jgi:hypothetical protein